MLTDLCAKMTFRTALIVEKNNQNTCKNLIFSVQPGVEISFTCPEAARLLHESSVSNTMQLLQPAVLLQSGSCIFLTFTFSTCKDFLFAQLKSTGNSFPLGTSEKGIFLFIILEDKK